MTFSIKLVPSAQKELEEALEYYLQISPNLLRKFYNEFVDLNELLEQNPYLEIRYKSVRTYKLKSFPYLVHFLINEELKKVIIIAVVFGKMKKTTFEDRINKI